MKKFKMIVVLSVGIFFLGNIKIVQSIGSSEKIYNNVFIEEIDVSHLTKEEATNKVKNIVSKSNELNLVYENKIYHLKLDEIGSNYNINESVQQAYNIGRNKDMFSNLKTRAGLKLGEKEVVSLKCYYDDDKMNDYIGYISSQINKKPIDATIEVENKLLKYSKEEYGKEVDKDKLREVITSKIDRREASDIKIPVTETKPEYLYNELVRINAILGTYETYFNSKVPNRVNNIRVAGKVTSDIILKQSKEFSFNYYVNNKDVKKNFKEAPVIINGKLKEGLGGGICQVSSTIYNAALYSGMEITTVRNHSIPSSYVSKGRDATVTTGNIDLKFKNNFETPVFIHNEVYKDKIVSTIYGNEENKKEIDVVTEVVKNIPNKVKVENSDKLFKGEREVSQKGRVGYKVNTFRVYKEDGQSRKEFIVESYYPPVDEIIIYGTKQRIVPEGVNTEVV